MKNQSIVALLNKIESALSADGLTDGKREELLASIRQHKQNPIAPKSGKKGLRAICGYPTLEALPLNPANAQRRAVVEMEGETVDEVTGLEWSYVADNELRHPVAGWRFPKEDPKAADPCFSCSRPLSYGRLTFIGIVATPSGYALVHRGCAEKHLHPVVAPKPAKKTRVKLEGAKAA